MDPILGLFWVIGVIWAAREAGRFAAGEYRKSRATAVDKAPKHRKAAVARQHAIGYWTREALGFFPVTRTGLHRGWLAHQTEFERRRAQREEARTSHLEARASVLSEMPQHRQRQADAQQRIDQAQQPPEPPAAPMPLRQVGAGTPPPAAPATNGAPMAQSTEVSYTQVLTEARQVESDADAAISDIRWQEMANTVDQLGAVLHGDRASLSDANEVAEALREMKKAMEATRDAAAAFASNLQRRHGGIKEAVDDAPAEPAEMGFYKE
jgi:hypothetical protein